MRVRAKASKREESGSERGGQRQKSTDGVRQNKRERGRHT